MSTQKRKFELFAKLQALGFTYEEAVALRRIEMTLHRWAEAECNGEIERNEATGKPERVSRAYINGMSDKRHAWRIADREAGALKRLRAITAGKGVWFYHQTDPRGCALYVGSMAEMGADAMHKLDQYYTRGLAVCS